MPRTAWQRAAAATASALGLVLLAACAEGYPSEQDLELDPAQLTPPQRLAAMNRLGQQAHPDHRWRYALADDCMLDVALDAKGQPSTRFDLPLRTGVADARFDKEQRLYAVVLSSTSGGARLAPPVLESANWANAVLMRGLVQALQRSCAGR